MPTFLEAGRPNGAPDAPVLVCRRTPYGFTWSGTPSAYAGDRHRTVFAEWTADATGVHLENDRYGMRPFFYAGTTDSLRLSTSITALIASGVPAELDPAALAVFLRAGFFVGDDTPFHAIKAVPPAARLAWSGGPSFTSAWAAPSASRLSRRQAIEQFGDVFTAAVGRRITASDHTSIVLLSGGVDSRHILLAMRELGRLPAAAVTVRPYPPEAGDDVAVAALVAKTVGVRHVILPQRCGSRVAAEREKNAATHYCADEHVQFLPLRDHFTAHAADVFDGLGGDVLSQSQRLDRRLHDLFVDGRVDEVAECVLGDASTIEPALERLLSRSAWRRFPRALAVARVADEARRYIGVPNPIAAFFFFTRTRREIALAPYGVLDGIAVHTPFLDPAVADFLLSLPFDIVADRSFHTDLLSARYPEVSHLPFAGKRKGADDSARARRDARALMRFVVERRSAYVDRAAVLARALRTAVSGRSPELWFLPRLVHLVDVASAGERRTPSLRA